MCAGAHAVYHVCDCDYAVPGIDVYCVALCLPIGVPVGFLWESDLESYASPTRTPLDPVGFLNDSYGRTICCQWGSYGILWDYYRNLIGVELDSHRIPTVMCMVPTIYP